MKAKAPGRREQRRLRTKEAIINAASDLFRRKGIANVTVTEITEAADVGYGTFYSYFHSLSDVVSAVAEETFRQVMRLLPPLLENENVRELAPAVGIRVGMRVLTKEPVIRWLLEQPYIFVDEWHKAVTPLILELVDAGPADILEGGSAGSTQFFTAAGGAQAWLRMQPWILISELNDAIEVGSSDVHEENLARMWVSLLGVDEARQAAIIETSRKIVAEAKLTLSKD